MLQSPFPVTLNDRNLMFSMRREDQIMIVESAKENKSIENALKEPKFLKTSMKKSHGIHYFLDLD